MDNVYLYVWRIYASDEEKNVFFFCGNWDKKDCLKKFGGSSDLKRCNNGIVKIMVSAGFLFPRWNKIRRIDWRFARGREIRREDWEGFPDRKKDGCKFVEAKFIFIICKPSVRFDLSIVSISKNWTVRRKENISRKNCNERSFLEGTGSWKVAKELEAEIVKSGGGTMELDPEC